MKRIPGWLVPAALTVAQVALWPGYPLLRGDPPPAIDVATGLIVTVVVAVAMLWRRSAPVRSMAVVLVALTGGAYGVFSDDLAVIAGADLIVLFSVAVWCSHRIAWGVGAATIAWQAVVLATTAGTDPDLGLELVVAVVVYSTAVALGRARHRWRADRTGAAQRLAAAEDRRARAADTERHRLARELHDVTAHHLTSIVVIASAAQRLGGTRPDLVTEARGFAARTGRDTLAALHRLVALLRLPDERPGPAATRLAELADGFRRLGQQVTVRSPPADPPPAVTDAAYGIAREALTNTLRYAPGSAVRLTLSEVPDGLELTVDDDGTHEPGVAGLGSGRGVDGMRERAAALGGTLAAGPRPGGGWQVRATLPTTSAPAPRARRRWRPDSGHVLDLAVLVLALFGPLSGLLVEEGDPDVAAAPVPLLLLVAFAHAVPLLWRRSRPWVVLGAVAVSSAAWPVLIGAGVVAPALGWIMLTGLGAEVIAVYAVARYAHRHHLTGLAIPAALSAAALAGGFTMALDLPPDADGVPLPVMAVGMGLATSLLAGPLVVGAWAAGFVVRGRARRTAAREHDAVAVATAQAIAEAGRERARVATGLRAAVLRDTARVASAADEGDLDQVLESARTALDAMRGLLNDLRDEPAPGHDGSMTGRDGSETGRGPQPTTAALPGLADHWRGGGREVTFEMPGAGRALPADVDLSAFRVVELLLAGDTGPVTVRADLTGDPLRITVRPMPADPGGEVAAGLRARLTAVGGSMSPGPDGLPEIRLPAEYEGVASSPFG